MCILFLALGRTGDRFRLILANNRDEFLDRPTRRADFLDELDAKVLAPVDLGYSPPPALADGHGGDEDFPHRFHGHGTWIGTTKTGRFAVLTNYREDPASTNPRALSRGYIVRDFLLGGTHLNGSGDSLMTPKDYAAWLAARADLYNGYSVVVGDLSMTADSGYPEAWYYSNRDNVEPTLLCPTVLPTDVLASEHELVALGLSNATLFNRSWPKVEYGRDKFAGAVAAFQSNANNENASDPATETLIQSLFSLLSTTDSLPAPPAVDWDPHMSSGLATICIPDASWKAGYATRTQTLVIVDEDMGCTYVERDRGEVRDTDICGGWTAEKRFRFKMGV